MLMRIASSAQENNLADTKKTFTSPVGRVVAGSLYKPRTTDIEGKPLVYRHGPNINQPKVDYFMALAIPKGAEKTWYETSWGQIILGVGAQCFPQAYQSPSFAWKVEDGDSQVPNSKGRKPCDHEGYKGHWILKTGSAYAPKVYQQEGNSAPVEVTQVDFIKPGYYVQALIVVDGNGSDLKPGVKLYNSMVCLRGYGAEISFGPDVASAGFGAAPLPAGVSAIPLAASVPLPSAPSLPAAPVQAAPPPSVPVIPNPAFLQVPAVPAAPSAVPAPPASGPKMTALAGAGTYDQFKAQGWTDAQLIANGYMTA
jgi:hypothetical protein